MDGDLGDDRRLGGTVQPANRGKSANQRLGGGEQPAAERYELRDPFAEVTYRAKTLPEMASQAERLGAIRFHAVAPDGTRIPIEKLNGEWKRTGPEPMMPPKSTAHRTTDAAPVVAVPTERERAVSRVEAEAEDAARVERLEFELNERYVIKRASVKIGAVTIGQTEYRYRGDIARIAFTESTFRLATDNNNPSVARSMVHVAEARRWQALRISGHEDFRRMVWLEASLRALDTSGYEPNAADRELLRKERDARQINRIEPQDRSGDATGQTKQSGRGSGGRKAVLAALEAVLVAKRVPARQREAVMAAAAENLATRLGKGEIHKVKVFDKSAPVQSQVVRPAREVQRTQERAPMPR